VAVATIAGHARLPTKTARNHLEALTLHGWINNAGRQHTRRGAPRRTCTLRLTRKSTAAIKPIEDDGSLIYGMLPWWACLRGRIALPWCAKAVLSVVMARLMALKATIQEQEGKADLNTEDLWGSIALLGDEDRFRFSLEQLELTGLDHKSIIAAKRKLRRSGVIRLLGGRRDHGGHETDSLFPNEAFRVVVTPSSEGRCFVDFEGYGKNGK
jgi:hypothetical protein